MNFRPTKSGGRIINGDMPHGRFRVEWDAQGKLVSEWIEIREPETRANTPCAHRGEQVDTIGCQTCKGSVKVKVYQCSVHGRCTIEKQAKEGMPRCSVCPDYEPVSSSS